MNARQLLTNDDNKLPVCDKRPLPRATAGVTVIVSAATALQATALPLMDDDTGLIIRAIGNFQEAPDGEQ